MSKMALRRGVLLAFLAVVAFSFAPTVCYAQEKTPTFVTLYVNSEAYGWLREATRSAATGWAFRGIGNVKVTLYAYAKAGGNPVIFEAFTSAKAGSLGFWRIRLENPTQYQAITISFSGDSKYTSCTCSVQWREESPGAFYFAGMTIGS